MGGGYHLLAAGAPLGQGIQYCSQEYQALHQRYGITCSMTDGYDCYQNALAERVNGILKTEYLLGRPEDIVQAKRWSGVGEPLQRTAAAPVAEIKRPMRFIGRYPAEKCQPISGLVSLSARRLLFAALGAGFQQLAEFLQLFLAQRLFNLFFGALIVDFAVVQLIRLLAGFSALAAGALKLLSVRWHTSTLNENSFSAAAARIFPSVPEEF